MPSSASSSPPPPENRLPQPGDRYGLWWYYGPGPDYPNQILRWHVDCPDPFGTGHDGEVWLDHQGGAICQGCRRYETGGNPR